MEINISCSESELKDHKFIVNLLETFGLKTNYLKCDELTNLEHSQLESLEPKCECNTTVHKTDLNTFPYGTNFEYDECIVCNKRHNVMVF